MNTLLKTGLALFLLTSLLHGCSDNPASVKSNGVEVFVFDNRIEVKNHLSQPIYYFAVERNTDVRIFWIPRSTDENEIKPKQQKKILLEDITGYEEGKKITFHYWTEKGTGTKTIEHFVIDT